MTTSTDPHRLERFVAAQEGVYPAALAELRAGAKRTHWMWFVFPQIAGLGHSAMAQLYAVKSRAEARSYLAHPVLGARLRECAAALLHVHDKPIQAILGFPDDLKLKSSMTLFEAVGGGEQVFADVLERFFQGERDARTLEVLAGLGS